MTVIDDKLDLRGRKVRLRGDGKWPAPVLVIPPDAIQYRAPKYVLYGWGNRTGRAHDHYAHFAFQNTCSEADTGDAARSCDIVEALPDEPSNAEEPEPNAQPEPGKPDALQPYGIRVDWYDLLPLAEIASGLEDAPYAEVKWGRPAIGGGSGPVVSCVIAGAKAVRRGDRVGCRVIYGQGAYVYVDNEGFPKGTGTARGGSAALGWLGPNARANAAEWWAEIRRREAITVVATVTPVPDKAEENPA